MVDKVYITWDEVSNMVDIIIDKIKKSGEDIDYVSGIPRGGVIPAVLLSHKFNKPYRQLMNLPNWRGLNMDIGNIMIIDDIADSGVTLKEWKEDLPDAKYSTLHYKEGSIEVPDFYAIKIPSNHPWVVYPWENNNSETIQDYLS